MIIVYSLGWIGSDVEGEPFMLNALKSWLSTDSDSQSAVLNKAAPDKLAELTAGLLVEASLSDGTLDEDEQAVIAHLLAEQFDLSDEAASEMLATAITDADARIELHGLTRGLREACSYEERIEILEMLWIVVLADDHLDKMEAQLMRRLSGLLYISDVDSGHAKKAAQARLAA